MTTVTEAGDLFIVETPEFVRRVRKADVASVSASSRNGRYLLTVHVRNADVFFVEFDTFEAAKSAAELLLPGAP